MKTLGLLLVGLLAFAGFWLLVAAVLVLFGYDGSGSFGPP